MIPPKPEPRADRVSLWQHLRAFRRDILSAQPARLYRARMAEFRTPFFRSYLINEIDLVETVLRTRPRDFPKSDRVAEGLRPLLGNSVFVTNGAVWARQRRIIDPAFAGGRIKDAFPSVVAAGRAAVARLGHGGEIDVEGIASHVTADVIFRSLFSIPISHRVAAAVFEEFRAFQRAQPLLNLAAFVPLPRWLPRPHRRQVRRSASRIRELVVQLTEARAAEIAAGKAPDDLATKIMTTVDTETGERFSAAEMVDQVAIFFLAGHETSAAALGWALYLLAADPEAQKRVREEANSLPDNPVFSDISALKFTRNCFREALRLYPPVPMMVRQAARPETFRGRAVARGSQIVVSPWHLHRHERIWNEPDAFRPDRFDTEAEREVTRSAYIPFSAGERVCPGAGFAMMEGTLLLAMLVRAFTIEPIAEKVPGPVAFLTVRGRDGIWLRLTARDNGAARIP